MAATREQYMEALRKADAAVKAGNENARVRARELQEKIREIDGTTTWTDWGRDALKSLPTAARRAGEAFVGAPGDLAEGAGAITGGTAGWIAEKTGLGDRAKVSKAVGDTVTESTRSAMNPLAGVAQMLGWDDAAKVISPSAQDIRENVTTPLLGEEYQPKYMPSKIGVTAAEIAPGALIGNRAGAIQKTAEIFGSAGGSELAGDLTKGTKYEGLARFFGGMGGGLAPSAASRVATPLPVRHPSSARNMDILDEAGVEYTAGQGTGRTGLQRAESFLGGSNLEDIMHRQGDQFTTAAMDRVGVRGREGRLTAQGIDDEFRRFDADYGGLEARNTMFPDRELRNDVREAVNRYNGAVPQSMRVSNVTDTATELANMQFGLSGDRYQSYRSTLERAARDTNDPNTARALRDLRTAMDSAMERSIAANNPDDLGAWREVSTRYRHFNTLLDALVQGGPMSAARGIITPQALQQAGINRGGSQFLRGNDPFADLAAAGSDIMVPMQKPGMGTAGHALTIAGPAGGVAALTGMSSPAVLAAAGIGAAAPYMAGKALMSDPMQGWLAGQRRIGMPTDRDTLNQILAVQALQSKRQSER